MRSLAIRFPDNDFQITFRSLLSSLRGSNIWHLVDNKQHVCMLLNELSFGMYVAFQCSDPEELTIEQAERTKRYLTLTPDNIFVDAEVTHYIKECDAWDNGEFFVIHADERSSATSIEIY